MDCRASLARESPSFELIRGLVGATWTPREPGRARRPRSAQEVSIIASTTPPNGSSRCA